MGLERERAAAIEPLLAHAVGEPDVAAEGSRAIGRILLSTEDELASIRQRAHTGAREIGEDAERRTRDLALERRSRIAELRAELEARALALAVRFEAVIEMLDAAERELARRAGQPEPVRDAREAHWRSAIHLTLRERARFTVSHEEPSGPAAASPAPVETPKRRRRWWRRWLREAA
ncbi:MAG: hypothetical protein AABM29_03805 [Actinomycetota bacterium]